MAFETLCSLLTLAGAAIFFVGYLCGKSDRRDEVIREGWANRFTRKDK